MLVWPQERRLSCALWATARQGQCRATVSQRAHSAGAPITRLSPWRLRRTSGRKSQPPSRDAGEAQEVGDPEISSLGAGQRGPPLWVARQIRSGVGLQQANQDLGYDAPAD